MVENSSIEWTDHTWNPWIGCRKISKGCDNCYMFSGVKRFGLDPLHIHKTGDKTFSKPLIWNKKTPGAKVFSCSWSDFFIGHADIWRERAYNIISHCKDLHFLLLTKRIERINKCLPRKGRLQDNVYIGVTIDSMETAAGRLLELSNVESRMRFLSIEPMTEPIFLKEALPDWFKPDWVICGGESGTGARYMDPKWAEQLMEDCRDLGISFFMKQMSGSSKTERGLIPENLMIKEFPGVFK